VLCVRKAVFVALIDAADAFALAIPAPYTSFQSKITANTPATDGKGPQFCASAPSDVETANMSTATLNAVRVRSPPTEP
jgi:hypothetical protein